MSNSAIFDFDDIRRRRNVMLGMESSGRLFSAEGKLETDNYPRDAVNAFLSPLFHAAGHRPKNWRMEQHLSFEQRVIERPRSLGKSVTQGLAGALMAERAAEIMERTYIFCHPYTADGESPFAKSQRTPDEAIALAAQQVVQAKLAAKADEIMERIMIDGPYSVGGYAKRPATTSARSPKVSIPEWVRKLCPGSDVIFKPTGALGYINRIEQSDSRLLSVTVIWKRDGRSHCYDGDVFLKNFEPHVAFVWAPGMPAFESVTGKTWTIDAIIGEVFHLRRLPERDSHVTEWKHIDRASFLRHFIESGAGLARSVMNDSVRSYGDMMAKFDVAESVVTTPPQWCRVGETIERKIDATFWTIDKIKDGKVTISRAGLSETMDIMAVAEHFQDIAF